MLCFDFERQVHAGLRFNFGVYEDGVWTPITLPWLTVTLMDFACGETVRSARESNQQITRGTMQTLQSIAGRAPAGVKPAA